MLEGEGLYIWWLIYLLVCIYTVCVCVYIYIYTVYIHIHIHTVVNIWSGSKPFIKVVLKPKCVLVLGQLWWTFLIDIYRYICLCVCVCVWINRNRKFKKYKFLLKKIWYYSFFHTCVLDSNGHSRWPGMDRFFVENHLGFSEKEEDAVFTGTWYSEWYWNGIFCQWRESWGKTENARQKHTISSGNAFSFIITNWHMGTKLTECRYSYEWLYL